MRGGAEDCSGAERCLGRLRVGGGGAALAVLFSSGRRARAWGRAEAAHTCTTILTSAGLKTGILRGGSSACVKAPVVAAGGGGGGGVRSSGMARLLMQMIHTLARD